MLLWTLDSLHVCLLEKKNEYGITLIESNRILHGIFVKKKMTSSSTIAETAKNIKKFFLWIFILLQQWLLKNVEIQPLKSQPTSEAWKSRWKLSHTFLKVLKLRYFLQIGKNFASTGKS